MEAAGFRVSEAKLHTVAPGFERKRALPGVSADGGFAPAMAELPELCGGSFWRRSPAGRGTRRSLRAGLRALTVRARSSLLDERFVKPQRPPV